MAATVKIKVGDEEKEVPVLTPEQITLQIYQIRARLKLLEFKCNMLESKVGKYIKIPGINLYRNHCISFRI